MLAAGARRVIPAGEDSARIQWSGLDLMQTT